MGKKKPAGKPEAGKNIPPSPLENMNSILPASLTTLDKEEAVPDAALDAPDAPPADTEEIIPSSPQRSPASASEASTEAPAYEASQSASPVSTPQEVSKDNLTINVADLDNPTLIHMAHTALARALELQSISLPTAPQSLVTATTELEETAKNTGDESLVDLITEGDETGDGISIALLVELTKRRNAIEIALNNALRQPDDYDKIMGKNKTFLFEYHLFHTKYYLFLKPIDKSADNVQQGVVHFKAALKFASTLDQLEMLRRISRLNSTVPEPVRNSIENQAIHFEFRGTTDPGSKAGIRQRIEMDQASKPSLEGQYTLGLLYLTSWDIKTCLDRAEEIFLHVIEQTGHKPDPAHCIPKAHEQLALLYIDAESDTVIIKAAEHLRIAAEQGSVSARHALYRMRNRAFQKGNNINFGSIAVEIAKLDRHDLPNETKALLQQAADGKPAHPQACYEFALRCAHEGSMTDACLYWKKSADAGYKIAKSEWGKHMSYAPLKQLLEDVVNAFEAKHGSSKSGLQDKMNVDLIRHKQFLRLKDILRTLDTTPINETLRNLIGLVNDIRGGQVTETEGQTLGFLPTWGRVAQGAGTIFNNGSQMGKMLLDRIQTIFPWLIVDGQLQALDWRPNDSVPPSGIVNIVGSLWSSAATAAARVASYVSTATQVFEQDTTSIVPFLSKPAHRAAVIALFAETVSAEMAARVEAPKSMARAST